MNIEAIATLCFGFAILHTFLVKLFQHWAHQYPDDSVQENFLHLMGEIEVVFGLWAGVFLIIFWFLAGTPEVLAYLNGRNFTEPAFVFVIMAVCATRPILVLAEKIIESLTRLLPVHRSVAFYFVTLTVGPLLGSFITEPAAMTVTALILLKRYYKADISRRFMYATLGLLFVNISIGGTMTPYAAPPVLMVASKWGWDLSFMMNQFGWKGALAILVSTSVVVLSFSSELVRVKMVYQSEKRLPIWVVMSHLLFLFLIVVSAHHMVVFMGLFLFFLGLSVVTREYQEELKIKEGLLVAFFLGGLVVLGGQQSWWLAPILSKLEALPLYLGAVGLTALTDNAALTYLGAQVPNLSETSKYFLVAGAVVGGGLTVIANAPNPAGYGILNEAFGEEGINPLGLFVAALPPTTIAAACFWFL